MLSSLSLDDVLRYLVAGILLLLAFDPTLLLSRGADSPGSLALGVLALCFGMVLHGIHRTLLLPFAHWVTGVHVGAMKAVVESLVSKPSEAVRQTYTTKKCGRARLCSWFVQALVFQINTEDWAVKRRGYLRTWNSFTHALYLSAWAMLSGFLANLGDFWQTHGIKTVLVLNPLHLLNGDAVLLWPSTCLLAFATLISCAWWSDYKVRFVLVSIIPFGRDSYQSNRLVSALEDYVEQVRLTYTVESPE